MQYCENIYTLVCMCVYIEQTILDEVQPRISFLLLDYHFKKFSVRSPFHSLEKYLRKFPCGFCGHFWVLEQYYFQVWKYPIQFKSKLESFQSFLPYPNIYQTCNLSIRNGEMGVGSSLSREIEGKDKDLFDSCLYNVALSLQTHLMYYSGRSLGIPRQAPEPWPCHYSGHTHSSQLLLNPPQHFTQCSIPGTSATVS